MACSGTYIGNCCGQCDGQIIVMNSGICAYLTLLIDPERVVYDTGYRQKQQYDRYIATRTLVESEELPGTVPCEGVKETSRLLIQETNECCVESTVSDVITYTPEPHDCTFFDGSDTVEVIEDTRTETTYYREERHTSAEEASPGVPKRVMNVILFTELLEPFSLLDFIAEEDAAFNFHAQNSTGQQTSISRNCGTDEYTVAQSPLPGVVVRGGGISYYSVGAGLGPDGSVDLSGYGVTRTARMVKLKRPYRIEATRHYPFSDTPGHGSVLGLEDFPKQQPPDVEEIDCFLLQATEINTQLHAFEI